MQDSGFTEQQKQYLEGYIAALLSKRGAVLSYSDPFVPQLRLDGHPLASLDLADVLREPPDCSIICTDHSSFDYAAIVKSGTLVVDTRNALKQYDSPTIFRL